MLHPVPSQPVLPQTTCRPLPQEKGENGEKKKKGTQLLQMKPDDDLDDAHWERRLEKDGERR